MPGSGHAAVVLLPADLSTFKTRKMGNWRQSAFPSVSSIPDQTRGTLMDFDSPWKEALEVYFRAFLALFFPHIHADIELPKWVGDAQRRLGF